MRYLTREELLNPPPPKREEVETPELGEGSGVILQELCAYERGKLLDEVGDNANLSGSQGLWFLGRLLAKSIVGEDGELLCTEEGDVDKLLGHSLPLIQRLGDIAMPLSGISVTEEADEDDEQGEPDAVKNSESGA